MARASRNRPAGCNGVPGFQGRLEGYFRQVPILLFMGVLVILVRAVLFGVDRSAPDSRKLAYCEFGIRAASPRNARLGPDGVGFKGLRCWIRPTPRASKSPELRYVP